MRFEAEKCDDGWSVRFGDLWEASLTPGRSTGSRRSTSLLLAAYEAAEPGVNLSPTLQLGYLLQDLQGQFRLRTRSRLGLGRCRHSLRRGTSRSGADFDQPKRLNSNKFFFLKGGNR